MIGIYHHEIFVTCINSTLTKRRSTYHYITDFYITLLHYRLSLTEVTESGQDHEVMVESSFELKPSDSKVWPLNHYTTLLLKNTMLEYDNRITRFLPFWVDVCF